ncbi:hypothetical protein LguiB_023640 [Lonicera macranthoides]
MTELFYGTPFIRKSATPPEPNIKIKCKPYEWHREFFGFGFNHVTNDFRILRVLYLVEDLDSKVLPEEKLYEFSIGSWRTINTNAYSNHIDESAQQAFSNGVLHWSGHAVSLDNNTCCIWVMKEYGVSESWTKQFTVDMQNGTPFGESGVWLDAGAYGFRDDSEILSSTTIGNLVSFDPESKRIKRLGIKGDLSAFYIDTYMESLVLLERD